MPLAAAIPAIIGVAGSVGGAAIASHGASSAANAQVQAANNAAQLQSADAQKALDFQKQQWLTSLGLMSPYYNTGTSALSRLNFMMGLKPQSSNLALSAGGVGPNSFMPGGGIAGSDGSAQDNIANLRNMASPLAGGLTELGSNGAPLAAGEPTSGRFMLPAGQTVNGVQPSGTGENQPMQGLNEDGSISPGPGQVLPPGGITANGLPGQLSVSAGGDTGDQTGFGSLMQPFGETFAAPTGATEQNDPGYQFRLNEGMKALQNSAAARGTLLTGGTAKDLQSFGQDYASNEYGNVYGRALGEFTNRYNIFKQNQNDQYNRLASLAGLGQTSAGQLTNAGQGFANNASNILMNSGQQIGQQYNNAGAARASGYAANGNIWGSTLGNLGYLATLMKTQPGTPTYPTPDYGAIGF